MRGSSNWNYTPYKPLLFNTGDIYICRIAPSASNIHIEWLSLGEAEYSIFARERGEGDFSLCGTTQACEFDITGVEEGKDYELFVCAGDKKSRVRLAKCADAVGTVINYLHPEDDAYSFSGKYLCSPSLLIHPDGYMLASFDLFAHGTGQNLTLIFRSDDNGESWHYVTELMPCFWGKLFLHKGDVYMLGVSTEYGDLLISRSSDGGKSFPAPVSLLRGTGGKSGGVGVHKNPQPLLYFGGRIYGTLEWGSWSAKHGYYHAAMVMSADENSDLTDPESWHFTEPLKYNPDWKGVAKDGEKACIEGTLAVSPKGELYNIMRYQTEEKLALAYRVNTEDHDAPLEYSHAIRFPGNLSKFMIKFDTVSGKYYSIVCRRLDEPKTVRNLLSLIVSDDLENWDLVRDLIDYRDGDPEKIGFQYVDFSFSGDDIVYQSRTAMNGAHNFHDSNYATFHRIKNFRI